MPLPSPAPAPTPPELPDLELARRVASGEPELFELLMRRHNQRLFRVVRGVVDDDGEAEDVLQDAWVRAFEHLGGFRGEASFSTWVTRIALHEAWARQRKGRRFVALDPAREEAIAAPAGDDPEGAAATGELRTALERAVAALRPHERTVFLLREVEGLTTAEAAEALELTEAAVKVRLHRAKSRLRRDLDRRLDRAARSVFSFDGTRCDRIVAAVLGRVTPPA
jgi:RNA polymerase sigma-70 factor (ECF subfamily)